MTLVTNPPLEHERFEESSGQTGEPESDAERFTLFLWGMLIAAVLVFLADRGFGRLASELRYDENITAWVTSGSLRDSVVRSWNYQGQSPLYFIILWAWQQVAGSSEVALRIPSIAACVATMWGLTGIGRDMGKVQVGIVAAIFFVSTDVGIMDARPYIFLMLSVVWALRYGIRWASPTGTRLDGVRWAVFGAATVYFQPLAIYALVPHLIICVQAWKRGRARETLALAVFGALLLVPIVPQVLALNARGETLVLTLLPGLGLLISAILPETIGVAVLVAGIVNIKTDWFRAERGPLFPLFIVGMIAPGLGLFAQSWLTGNTTFVLRYFLPAIPLAGLFLGLVLLPMRKAAVVTGVIVPPLMSAVSLSVGGYLVDWSYAVEQIQSADQTAEVWAMGGLIESYHSWYFQTEDANEYLSCHFIVNGANRELQSIPAVSSETTDPIHQQNVDRVQATGTPVMIVEQIKLADDGGHSGPNYAIARLLDAGYEVIGEDTQGHIRVVELEKA